MPQYLSDLAEVKFPEEEVMDMLLEEFNLMWIYISRIAVMNFRMTVIYYDNRNSLIF
jgi:hypothetical protein